MPAEVKTCTLYLNIFPNGSRISRKRLITRWIAEGFVSEKQGLSVEDVAEAYFNHLIRRNIIRPEEHSRNGKVKSCQVHDIVLEFIVSKASEENFVTVVGGHWLPSSKVRRLSIKSGDSKRASGTDRMNLSHVRSLTMFGNLSLLPSNSFKFPVVQVLDLQGCNGFKQHHTKEICNIFLIKYLCLRRTDITKLPKMIGKLQYLETLEVRETSVTKLPRTICQLERLVNMLGGNKRTRKALKLPADVKKIMTQLRILSGIEITNQSAAGAACLHHLTCLRKLAIYNLNVTTVDNHFGNLLSSIEHLGGYGLRALLINEESSEFLESLRYLDSPPLFLDSLELYGKLVQLPEWITQLRCVTKLTLPVTTLREANLEHLSRLRSLFSLTFSHSGAKPDPQANAILEESNTNSDGEIFIPSGGFMKLKLLLFCAPLLPTLRFQEEAMPNLEKLGLRFNTMQDLFGLQNLQYLKEVHLHGYHREGEITKSILENMKNAAKGARIIVDKYYD